MAALSTEPPAASARSAAAATSAAGAPSQDLPDPSVKVADLFSGIVRLDGAGKATIPLALPDFQGQLHLMAVAWTAEARGLRR